MAAFHGIINKIVFVTNIIIILQYQFIFLCDRNANAAYFPKHVVTFGVVVVAIHKMLMVFVHRYGQSPLYRIPFRRSETENL